ncbi:hypothetical protein [Nocardia abscessus]|uniref:hypothetical protein n=1 Tax=Nocardia abscessus TaxID=120957 RepID=UPI0002F1D441|nr:hypothetical protein [Nocardia abscessus]MCC3329008.1 hypothetical protein [Nocardia abscessus]
MRQTDGRAITNPENAQSFSHAEIEQAADAMNPAGLDSALAAWSAIAAAVTNAGQQFESAIKKAVEQQWEGAAADSAVRGVRDYAARMGEFGEALGAQSVPLSAAADAATKFKMSVPDLADTSGSSADPEQRNAREEQARDEMNTQYIQPYGATAPAIPTLPPPVSPAAATPTGLETGTGTEAGVNAGSQPVDGTRPADTSSSGDKPSSGGDPTSEHTASPSSTAEEGTPDDQPQQTSENTPETTTPQAVSQSQDAAATTPASTTRTQTPTSATPLPSTAPLPTAPAAVTPVSFDSRPNGTPARPGTPGAVGTPSAAENEARSGTSRPAQPTAPAASPASSAPAGRPGAPGVPGYPGMVPPGMRGRRTDDDEHKSPKYLRTEEHAKELLGEVQPTVPPALGEK